MNDITVINSLCTAAGHTRRDDVVVFDRGSTPLARRIVATEGDAAISHQHNEPISVGCPKMMYTAWKEIMRVGAAVF